MVSTSHGSSLVGRLARRPKDQGLWSELYRTLYPRVYYSAYRASRGQPDLAADVTQEAFERLIRYADLSQFQSDEHVCAYLRQTARRRLIDAARALERFAPADADVETLPGEPTADALDAEEIATDVARLAAELPPADRDLLAALLLGRSLPEIARQFDISYSAAAVRVHRIRARIRSKINGV